MPAVVAGKERRKTERVHLKTDVGLETESNFYGGFVFDLSTGGLFVTSMETLPELGTEVDVSFTLPSGMHVQVRAVVRWQREGTSDDDAGDMLPGVGLQFLDLPEASKEGIERFVRGREPIFYEG